jgi:cation:H+ antiporter
LTRLGHKARLAEGLVGLLAALGADAPELASALTAILSGAHDVGVGVVLGSNLFNLAALLGLSAAVAGGVATRREPLVLDALVGFAITICAALLLPRIVPAWAALALAGAIFVLYVLVLAHFHGLARRFWPEALEIATDTEVRSGSWAPVVVVPLAVAGVVAGSLAMVKAALQLGAAWHLSDWLLGSVILAGLTSLPNLYVALHFARAERGSALVSAAMNSNTINLLGGLLVPALLVGLRVGDTAYISMAWLLGLTFLVVGLALRREGLSRGAGAVVIAAYGAFVLFGLASGA